MIVTTQLRKFESQSKAIEDIGLEEKEYLKERMK